MKPRELAPRILAVVLSACLILPPHAYALRPQQREAEPQRTGLEEALRSGDPDALVRVVSSHLAQWIAPVSAVSSSGLEETWDKHPEVLPILERYPDPAVRPGVLFGKTDPESGRDHIQQVLRITQLLAEDAGLSDEDQRLLRIAAALHDAGSLQHLDVAAVMEILKLARKKIPVPFRLRDLADHYQLTWETVGGLFDRIRADLGQNFPDADLMGPVRPDVTAIRILDELVREGAVRLDAPADRQVVEAVIRESVWAGLLATQPGYTVVFTKNLTPDVATEVVKRAQRLAEFLEAADTVEASANLARTETFYSGRPRDLANLIWSLGTKVREQAISREMAARALSFLSPGQPRHVEMIAILEKSRRIGQAGQGQTGQAWSELDRQIMARVEAGATLEELQAGLAVQELIGEDLVQGQRWPKGVPKTLGVVPDHLVQQFVKTWTARAKAAGVDFSNPNALRAYLRREIIPWRIYPAAGRASRVSATGLIRKAVVRADGYSTSVRQAREPVNWGGVEDIIVVDAVIGYQLLKEGARVGPEVREELADRISKKEIPALVADFGRSAEKADEEAGKQKDEKKAAGLREAAKLYRQAQQDLVGAGPSLEELIKGGWELAADPKQRNDVAHLLREMEKMLSKALPVKELAQYVGEQLAAGVLRRLIEEKGKTYSEDFVDPARVRDVLGERVILAVASPDGPGGAFREGIRRLRDWGRLNEHAYIMPVYSDYPSASLDTYPNPYLVGLLVGLSNPGDPQVLPKVVTSAKAPLKSLPYAKGNVVFKNSAEPEAGAVAIREWRDMTSAEQTEALAGFGRSLKQQDVPEAAIPSVENWGKLTPAEQDAVKQGYIGHTPAPGAQPFYHALNAGIFLFETALVEELINGGVWTPYGNYDRPDRVKFKPHEYWYTDLVEAAATAKHVARVVQLGPDAPDGLKDTGRIAGYAADRNTMVAGLLKQHGVQVEPGATVTISSASATFSPAVDLPRMFPGTATLKGRVHLDTTVTVGEGAILAGTDQPVVLLGNTTVPGRATITGTSVDWRVGNQVPDDAILLAPGEMDWLRTQGVVVAEDALVYLMPVEGVSLASPKDRQPVLKGIFGGETDQVWLEGRIALEPAVRIAKGTWLNGWHRPVVLRGRTQIGQGRSVAAAELTDTVLEPVPVLDGFNYEPPRVGQDTDVWNAILIGQVIPLGRQVHDAIAGGAVENQSRKGRLRRLGQIVVDPQRYVPGVARLAERSDEAQEGLIGFMKKEIVGMFEDKIVGKETREGAMKALERFLAHPAALQLTNEELYRMGFFQMQYLAGGADPFAADKQGPERDALRRFATTLVARAHTVDLKNEGLVRELLDELTLHATGANFLDRQSESARKVFGQPGFFDDFEKNLSQALSEKLRVDGRPEWMELALDTKEHGTFLYLVDNVEEAEVDAALWVLLARMGHRVVIGAKSGPARGDATVADVRQVIEAHEVLRQLEQDGRLRLIGTGSQTYGTLLDRASDELIQALNDPNLRAVVMKGQGNLYTTVTRNAMKVPVVTLLLSKGEDAAMVTLGIQERKDIPPKPVPIIAAVVPSGRHLISRVTSDSEHPKGFRGSLNEVVEEERALNDSALKSDNYHALVRIFGDDAKAQREIQSWMRRSHLTFRQVVLGQLHEGILQQFLGQDPEGFVQRQREMERYNAIFFGGGSASQTNQEVRLQSPRLEKQWMHTVSVTNGTDNGGRTSRIQQAMQPHYGHTFTVGDITAAFKGMFSSEVQDRLLEPEHKSIWANEEFWRGQQVAPTFTARLEWLLTDFAGDSRRLSATPDFVRLAVELLNLAAVADKAFVGDGVQQPRVHDVNLPSVRHVIFNAIMEAVGAYSADRQTINHERFRVGLYLLEQAFGLPHRILHNSLDPLELYAELTDSKGNVFWKSTETFNTPGKIGDSSVYSVGEHGQVAISLSPDAAKPGVKVQYQTFGFIDPSKAAQGKIDLVTPEAEPDVIQVIQQAEPGAMVVFGPSSFVVSLSSIFLPKFVKALQSRPDLSTTMVLNLTRNSETLGWTAADYIRFWEQHVTKARKFEQTVQYLVVNNKQPDEKAKAEAEQLAQAAGSHGQPNYPKVLDAFDRLLEVEGALGRLKAAGVKDPKRELIFALAFADHGESRETYKERGGVPLLTDEELLDLVNRGVTVIQGDLVATEGWKYTPGKGRIKRYGAFHDQKQLAKIYELIMAEHRHRLAQEERLERGGLIELPSAGLEERPVPEPVKQLAADWSTRSSVTLDVRVHRLDMADKEAFAARTNHIPHSYLVYELLHPETGQVVASMMVGFSPADVSPNDVILADVTMDQELGGTALDVQFLRWIVQNTLDPSIISLRHRHWEDPEDREWAIRLSRSEQARQEFVNQGRVPFETETEDIPQYGIRMERASSAAWKTDNLPEEDVWFRGRNFPLPGAPRIDGAPATATVSRAPVTVSVSSPVRTGLEEAGLNRYGEIPQRMQELFKQRIIALSGLEEPTAEEIESTIHWLRNGTVEQRITAAEGIEKWFKFVKNVHTDLGSDYVLPEVAEQESVVLARALLGNLRHQDPNVRLASLSALFSFVDADHAYAPDVFAAGIPTFVASLSDGNQMIRRKAGNILRVLSGKTSGYKYQHPWVDASLLSRYVQDLGPLERKRVFLIWEDVMKFNTPDINLKARELLWLVFMRGLLMEPWKTEEQKLNELTAYISRVLERGEENLEAPWGGHFHPTSGSVSIRSLYPSDISELIKYKPLRAALAAQIPTLVSYLTHPLEKVRSSARDTLATLAPFEAFRASFNDQTPPAIVWLPPVGGSTTVPAVVGGERRIPNESGKLLPPTWTAEQLAEELLRLRRQGAVGTGYVILPPTWTAEEQVEGILRLRRQGALGTSYVHQISVQGRMSDEFKYVALALLLASPYSLNWEEMFFNAPWGKVAPLVHDGGRGVEVGRNPFWTRVEGRTDFLQRVTKVYLGDLETLEALPEAEQIKRSRDLAAAESEEYERTRLLLETRAYQRLALALHAKLGTVPKEIPPDLQDKLEQHWVDFESKMRALLGEFGLKGAAEVTWFTDEARLLAGWDQPRQEAPWEPIQKELIHLEEVRKEYPQPLFNRANQILQEVTDAIDRDLGLAAAGLEEPEEEIAQRLDRLEQVLRAPKPRAYDPRHESQMASAWKEIAEMASSGKIPPERLPQMAEAVALSLPNYKGNEPHWSKARVAFVALVKAELPPEALEDQLRRAVPSSGSGFRSEVLLFLVGEIPDAAWRPILPKLVADLSHPDQWIRFRTEGVVRALVYAWAERELDLPEELEPAFFFAWKDLLDAEDHPRISEPLLHVRAHKAIRWFAKSGSARVAGYLADTLRQATSSMQAGEKAQRREGHRAYRALIRSLLQDPEFSLRFDATLREGIRATLGQLGSAGEPSKEAEATLQDLIAGSYSSPIRDAVREELNAFASWFEQDRDGESLRAILSVARIWATRHHYSAYMGEGQDWVFDFYRPDPEGVFESFLRRVSPTVKAIFADALSGLVRPLVDKSADARDELNRWEGQAALASLTAVGLIPNAWIGRAVDSSVSNLAGRDELREAAQEALSLLASYPSLTDEYRREVIIRTVQGSLWGKIRLPGGGGPNPFEPAKLLRTDGERVALARNLLADILGRETGPKRARATFEIARYLGQFEDEALSEFPLVRDLKAALAALPTQSGFGVGEMYVLVLDRAMRLHPEWVLAPPDSSQLESFVWLLPRLFWLPPMGGKIPVVLSKKGKLLRDSPGELEPTWLAEQQVQEILKLRQQGRLGAGYVHQMTVQGRLPDPFKYVALALILASPYENDWTQPFFKAHWGKVAPMIHDGGNVELGLNPLWKEVTGRTDFIQRVAKVYLKDLEVLEGLPESEQIRRRGGDLQPAESEAYERARLLLEARAYQRLALALHAKMGTAPPEIPSEIQAKLKQHWIDFEGQMRALLGEFGLKGAAEVTWFTDEARLLAGWDQPRQEAPWEPIQKELIHLERVREEYPQPLFNRANQILQEVTDAIDRDLGLAAAGVEEEGRTQTLLRADVSGPVVMDIKGIPQTVSRHRISASAAIPTAAPGTRLLLAQEGVLPPAVTTRFAEHGWKVETLPARLTPERAVGEVNAGLKEWIGSMLLVIGTELEGTVPLLPVESRLTTVFIDPDMAATLAPNVLVAYLLQTLEAFPGGIRRLESVTQAGVEEFQAVSTWL